MEPAIENLGKVMTMVPSVLEEAAEELVGKSKRKWALVLVAFIIGAVAAVLVIRFEKRTLTSAVLDAEGDSAKASEAEPSIDLTETSAWSQLRRSEAALRARVGNLGSRMNVRRARSINQ
jgi:hypothetical protein